MSIFRGGGGTRFFVVLFLLFPSARGPATGAKLADLVEKPEMEVEGGARYKGQWRGNMRPDWVGLERQGGWVGPEGGAMGSEDKGTWVWVRIKTPGDRRF